MGNPDFKKYISSAKHILVIQAENPDGDSVASSLALESLLDDNYPNIKVTMFCKLTTPAHLKYLKGQDRVTQNLPKQFDLAILVDCAEQVLIEKTLRDPNSAKLNKVPVLVLDHHKDEINLPFKTVNFIDENAVSTGALIYNLAKKNDLKVSKNTAELVLASILSDTLGLSLDFVTADDFRMVGELTDLGASVARIDTARREYNKRPQFVTKYKADLLGRVEYLLDGRLAYIHIPWEDIENISGIYNPPVLVFEDMRLTEGVQVVMAVKSYKSGRMTAKMRTNPGFEVVDKVAAKFNCGGHPGAAGCKVDPGMYTYDEFKSELVKYTGEELDKVK